VPSLSDQERLALGRIRERATRLGTYLQTARVPDDSSALAEWFRFLAAMKEIVGNSDNDLSLVASIMARDWLCSNLKMCSYDAVRKAQNAPGLDVDERTEDGARVVAEIKTTEPYQKNDLGAAQLDSFRKDFAKLNTAVAAHRFFFVTSPRAFEMMRAKYAAQIPDVTVVLLPSGETFRAGPTELTPMPPAPAPLESGAVLATSPRRDPIPSRDASFPLTLHKTYLEQGFFNVPVDYDRYVRQAEGPVELVLVSGGREHRIEAKVNRSANVNGTAIIMGGARLREWFLSNCDLGAELRVDLSSTMAIRILHDRSR